MGLIKATTGQYTSVYVANRKQFTTIKTVQAVNATAGATANYVNAFDSTSSILSYTNMNDTPVTGKFDVIISDNIDFQAIAMGYGSGDTFDGFSLSRALTEPLFILLAERDIKSNSGYSALWLPEVNLTSDGESQTIKGIKIVSYGLAAGDKIRLPNKAIIETVAISTGSGSVNALNTPVVYNGEEALPAGLDSDGTQAYFVADNTNGVLIPKSASDGFTMTGGTITLTGTYSTLTEVLVAYQYTTA